MFDKNSDKLSSEIVRDGLTMMIFQKLLEVEVCKLVCLSSMGSENSRNISEASQILFNCIKTWESLWILILSNKVDTIYNSLIIFEEKLRDIDLINKFPNFIRKKIEEEKDKYNFFIKNELKNIFIKNISEEKLLSELEYEIFPFKRKSRTNIEKYVDSFSKSEKDKIIESIFQNKNKFENVDKLAKSIIRSSYDENLKEEKIPEVVDIFDSRIEKLNKMFQSQQVTFKNKIIDLEESIKNQRDELKKQTEDNIQTLRENLEGQVGRIGMEKALSVASSRIRKSRRLAFAGFIVGLVLLFFVGCSLLFSNSDDINNQMIWSTQNIIHTVGRYIVVATIVWWTWFIAKRVSQLVKIEEDYAFKETIVLFYKGHCEEVADDEFLSRELLQLTIKMFAENPTRLLEKRECALPVQELVTIITDSLKAGKK